MSSIDKMYIEGIRSFGPREPQLIQFFAPVTLIVGPNGSGKTTIIECLKYATTGDLPPMGKGGAFVFDPKLLDEIETKGKIKLFIRDTGINYIQVQKNLVVTQKAKKVEFRTLETMISRYDKELNILSTITNKCINTDFEIVNALGVSKAILENVIFCHQEDSNWPLSEGKNLKTKFDDIFAATKYIKALDALRKVRVEKSNLIKQYETEKKHLEIHKQKADSLKNRLDENKSKHDAHKTKASYISDKLNTVEKRLESLYTDLRSIQEINLKVQSVENEKNLIEKQIVEYKQKIKNVFKGSDEELYDKIRNFDGIISNINDEIRKKENEMNKIAIHLKEYSNKKTKTLTEIGALENEHKNYNINIDKFNKKFKNLSKEINYDIELYSETIDINNLPQLLNNFNQYLRDYENETNKLVNIEKNNEKSIEEKITSSRDKKSKLDQNLDTITNQKRKNEIEIKNIKLELNNAILLIQNSEKLNNEINQTQVNLDSKIEEFDLNELKQEINEIENEKQKYIKNLNDLNTELEEIHGLNEAELKIDFYKTDIESKQKSIKDIRSKYKNEFLKLFNITDKEFDELDDIKLKAKFSQKCNQLDKDIDSSLNINKTINKEITTIESNCKLLRIELGRKEQQFENYKNQLKTIEDVDKFDLTLQEIQESQKGFIDEKGFLNGVDKTYQRFIKQLSVKNDDCSCPVCFRNFKDSIEIETTVDELKKYTAKLPQKLKDLDQKINFVSSKYESMLKLKNIVEAYRKLRDQDLPSLRKQIEDLDNDELKMKRNALEENEIKTTSLKNNKEISIALNNQVTIIQKYVNEINEAENKLEIELLKLNGNKKSGRSVDRIKAEKHSISEKLDLAKNQQENKQKKLNKQQDEIQRLKDKLKDLTIKKLQFDVSTKNLDTLKEKLDKLSEENKQFEKQIEQNKIDTNSLGLIINEYIEEKNEKTKERLKLEEQRKIKSNELITLKNEVNEYGKLIKNFEQNDMKRLNNAREILTQIENEEKNDNQEYIKIRNEIEVIKNESSQQEFHKRELDDNKRMREKKLEFENKLSIFNELKQKIAGLNQNEVKKEINNYEIEKKDLRKQLTDAETSLSMLEGTIKTLNIELETDEYRNAELKYGVCMKDLYVLQLSLHDIDKYYKALDKAIMNYHSMKMNEINKSIKQIWKQVYRGIDIDSIEVRSDCEFDNQESKTRRTYNYRVVIIKGDTTLDMRGRCSMGQKVLASIVIRLALAETFCLNCGILALDEPTTNLDRDNIESLASALIEIIKTRSSQKNFQLVIITHDEDFVELLGRSEYMDEFYRVHKDERGFSRISRKNATSA